MKLNLEAASVSRSPARARVSQASACGLALALALPCVLAGCGKPPSGQPHEMAVQTERARSLEGLNRRGDAAYMAIVRAENETDLSFKLGGIVDIIGPETGFDWKEGTPVKEGAMLANLKPSEFVNALNSAKAQAELATKQLGRLRKLRESDTISPQEMDVAEANYRTAQAQLDQASQNLKDSQLRASIDGMVLARYVNAGMTVPAGQRVLRFAGTATMQVELGVPDRLVSFFSPGKEVEVEISSLEGRPPFRGRVSEVGVAASQEGRLFRVVVKVPNPESVIRSGMTATVRVGGQPRVGPGAVLVPLSALITCPAPSGNSTSDACQLAVFVVEGGKAARRLVRTDDIIKNSIIVTDGLKAGEEVVTSGASFLYDGQPLIVLRDAPNGD